MKPALKRESSKFVLPIQEEDIDEARQSDMIKKWLNEVKGDKTRYREVVYGENLVYLDEDEIKDSGRKDFREEFAKAQKMKNIQSGDHFFMRPAKSKDDKDIMVMEPSGDHILRFIEKDSKDVESNICVPFLLDYTLRWNSRVENSGSAVGDKVPLIFASYSFFCSTRMLYFTIGLLIYHIVGQVIATAYFGALTTDIFQTVGVLCGVCLVCKRPNVIFAAYCIVFTLFKPDFLL
jgi:hypothetical protein